MRSSSSSLIRTSPTPSSGLSYRHAADARATGCLALPIPRDALLTTLAKAALPPRVVAALDELQQASYALRSPVSLAGLMLSPAGGDGGGTAPQPLGLSPRNLACLWALVVAALFLAGTLGC
jgi:hypothetical protein